MKHHLSKRARVAISGGIAALLLTGLIGCASAPAEEPTGNPTDVRRFEGQTLTIAGYSAAFNDEWAKSFGAYFEKQTGITVKWLESSTSQAIAKIAAAGGKPDFDLMLADSANLAQAVNADVVAKVDPGSIPNLDALPQSVRNDYGIPTMYYRYGTCYRTDKFAEAGLDAPSTSDSWFAPELAGRLMLPSSTATQWLISAPVLAQSVGGSFDDPAAAVATLAKLKPYGFFNASGDIDAAMTAGDVWISVGNVQGRCLKLKKQGVPVDYAPWQLDIAGKSYVDLLNPDNIVLVKGTKNAEMAELFMNEYLSSDAVSSILPLYQFIAGTPPTEAGVEALKAADPSTGAWMITDTSTLYLPDYHEFLPHLAEWNTAWNGILQ